jgi:hypothetical protein
MGAPMSELPTSAFGERALVVEPAVLSDRRSRRVTLERELEAERAARRALESRRAAGDHAAAASAALARRVEASEAALAAARAELDALRAQVGELERGHAAMETAAGGVRSTLEAERERAAAQEAELDAIRSRLAEATARAARLESELAESRAASAAQRDRADAAEAALEAERAGHATTRAELGGARAVCDAARAEAAALRAALQAARVGPPADAGAAPVLGRIAQLEHAPPARPLSELARTLAGVHGEVAQESAATGSPDLSAALDAAAGALRAARPAPAPAAADEPPATSEPAATEPPATERPATTEPPASEPARSLLAALGRLTAEEPATAAAVLAGLLPAQGAVASSPLEYDLTLRGRGTFAVSLADGPAEVRALARPRPRHAAAAHVRAGAPAILAFLAGEAVHVGRFRGPIRIRGDRRALAPLAALRGADLPLAVALEAGASLQPVDAWQLLVRLIPASWTRGHAFTVAQVVEGPSPETVLVTARDGDELAVTPAPPAQERSAPAPDAVVTISLAGWEALLRRQPGPPGARPIIRGDRAAVEALRGWVDRAIAGV